MGQTTPLRRFAGLDGLRAIAVAAVLVYHAEPGLLPGGFLGVDLFFVLSGFLITSLVLDAAARTGRVDLRAFWARRVRRLLPALLLVLAGTVAATALLAPEELGVLRRDVLAALAGATNWELLAGGESYFAAAGRPSLLRHLWSLGVEAQFYLLWPVVLAVAVGLGRLWLALGVAVVGALASAVAMAVLLDPGGDPSRVYFGSDTHASGLLVGSALAIVAASFPLRDPDRRRPLATGAATVAGAAALAAVVVAFVLADAYEPLLYEGGLVAFVLAAAVLVGVLPVAGPLAKALELAPLRWLGERSYGIYLWHWPVYQLSRPGVDVDVEAPVVHVARVAVTLVLAELSWRFVEQPIRARGWRIRRSAPALPAPSLASAFGGLRARMPTGLAAAAGVGMTGILAWSTVAPAVPAAAHGVPIPGLPAAVRDGTPWSPGASPLSSAMPEPVADSPRDEVRPGGGAGLPGAGPSEEPASRPSPSAPAASASPAPAGDPRPRVFAVGDSVMLSALDPLRRRVKRLRVDAEVGRFFTDAPAIVDRQRAAGGLGDVVVIHLGNNGPFYRRHFDAVMSRLRDVPLVVFVNLKLPRDWEAHNNKLLEQAVRHHANAVLLDWHAVAVEQPDLFWDDGYHVRAKGARLYAELLRDAITAGVAHDMAADVEPAR